MDIYVKNIHPSWLPFVNQALQTMDQCYLEELAQTPHWLPGIDKIFNAFSLPLASTRFILFGESPYPRAQSANGYAFWDAKVSDLWSEKGLSKTVNRATSLRNLMKMLLVASGDLNQDTYQPAIAEIDKSRLVKTIDGLFNNLIDSGFLLLNASLIYRQSMVDKDAKAWRFFMNKLLQQLAKHQQKITLLLFGRVAKMIPAIQSPCFNYLSAEHPYNISFIQNTKVIQFFKPLQLLDKRTKTDETVL